MTLSGGGGRGGIGGRQEDGLRFGRSESFKTAIQVLSLFIVLSQRMMFIFPYLLTFYNLFTIIAVCSQKITLQL